MVKEKHIHVYDKIKLRREMDIDNRSIPHQYNGTPGDKAILVRVCGCGHELAFEYGAYPLMKTKLKELE